MIDKIFEAMDKILPGDWIVLGALISGGIAYALSGNRAVLVYTFSIGIGFFVSKILRSLNG